MDGPGVALTEVGDMAGDLRARDRRHLREALKLARRGRGLSSPNPLVGAIVTDRTGRKIGEGFHTYAGKKHAEVLALEEGGEAARGGTLYVSLEPCNHHGRTPPCTEAIIEAGVRRVVAPIADPAPHTAGSGFTKLRAAGIEVERPQELAGEAQRLNEAFFHYAETGRPFVTLKVASTLDGRITVPGRRWITSQAAREHVQQLRHDHDAILTGIGTVLADDCRLTDRTGLPRRRKLLRIVADSQLRLPLDSELVRTCDGDLVVVTTSRAAVERRERIERSAAAVFAADGPGGRVDLTKILDWIGGQERISLLIEAGCELNGALLLAGLVDKVMVYFAPLIAGSRGTTPIAAVDGDQHTGLPAKLRDVSTTPVGEGEFRVEGYVVR